MQDRYEKLGAFYLGGLYDDERGARHDALMMYDSKDLTTHAVCVGMTGSGKTGLCVTLLEEAAIDGIPAIAIDPKGDLGNLLLTFPQLRPADFRPWVTPEDAARKGRTLDEHAKATADLWKKGLASWHQDGGRVARMREAAEVAIYTPGSQAGIPLSVLRSFDAPPAELLEDGDALRDRVMATVSGLLAMLGIDADPIRSREHILLSNILDRAWREGRNLNLPSLIGEIQKPPFDQIGVFDIDSFFPSQDRFGLAMQLNNLVASPGFGAWMEGEQLDIQSLLYTSDGKPRIAILSIAHLGEAERMFFVTLVLNELVAWMRSQPGTTSLRALLYMDEVFGYLPPTANPPSKIPMLTLLKQARAYGLGCILATQNPVDLDYKALSNAGTWFLGRLQTERDKMRVLEGLEGASSASGRSFDRQAMEATLAGLKSRVFLMNNVHEDEPVLFHTRWAMSYLRGPLTRKQIQKLMKTHKAKSVAGGLMAEAPPGGAARAPVTAPKKQEASRPAVPPKVEESFFPVTGSAEKLLYRPALFGAASLHYANARAGVDEWRNVALIAPLGPNVGSNPWGKGEALEDGEPGLESEPEPHGKFAKLPSKATRATSYTQWQKSLKGHVYKELPMVLWKCKSPKALSKVGENERDFRVRLRTLLHENRDLAVEKLRKKYAPKLARLQERIRKSEERVDREASQYKEKKMSTAISFGATVLGALFGRKVASVGTVTRAGSAIKSASRTAREKGDIGRAQEQVAVLQQKFADLEAEFEEETETLKDKYDEDALEVTEMTVRPRKSDISVERFALAWTPWTVDEHGVASPAFDA